MPMLLLLLLILLLILLILLLLHRLEERALTPATSLFSWGQSRDQAREGNFTSQESIICLYSFCAYPRFLCKSSSPQISANQFFPANQFVPRISASSFFLRKSSSPHVVLFVVSANLRHTCWSFCIGKCQSSRLSAKLPQHMCRQISKSWLAKFPR